MTKQNLTPMMQQYWTAKKSLGKDHLLLFRLGDFFELFYEDAIIGAKLLEITLTQRRDIPMCGVPAHSVDAYIKKLLAQGQKVAICDQTSPVQQGSLVDREVVEKITPGTISNSVYLDSSANNYLSALTKKDKYLLYAWVDISTAELYVEKREYSIESIRNLLGKTSPKELLFPEYLEEQLWMAKIRNEFSIQCNALPDWNFSIEEGAKLLKSTLSVETLKAYALEDTSVELAPICALLSYVSGFGKNTLSYLSKVSVYYEQEFLELDADAIYNLELFYSMREKSQTYSLFSVLQATQTPMGNRLLQRWLAFPLKDIEAIRQRHEHVQCLLANDELFITLQGLLPSIIDMPRILTRITLHKAHPKDLDAMFKSIESAMSILDAIQSSEQASLHAWLQNTTAESALQKLHALCELLQNALVANPPTQFGTDYIINRGYNSELDTLRNLHENQQQILQEYVENEQKNVPFTLRIKYNQAIGYFFDIGQNQRGQCPEHFILRQSLTKQDRYKTPELIALETEILDAESKLLEYEEKLFVELLMQVQEYAKEITILSNIISELDVYVSFARIAIENNYVRPEIIEDNSIEIQDGRHPVIEKYMPQGEFISNNVALDTQRSFIMLTGPNMSGKSTYLRQNALIIIMAQLGSFVPARSAKIGLRDKIFCRVGASDNLVKGESTFLVEMSETAYILHQATDRSLVIMDEIGRGTSVTDGESIAQAVAEYFLVHTIFTLFATHYHNLTDLQYPNMKNFTLSIERNKELIVFTRHIKEGAVKNSYGIEVAKMAGIPDAVLERARVLLQAHIARQDLSSQRHVPHIQQSLPFVEEETQKPAEQEQYIKNIVDSIVELDCNAITPMEALQMLVSLQTQIQDKRASQ